ncbi:hypothetical protein CcaverHIS002_0404610 [Cutaneotrichosporon cavernicola]|uniref:Uncharacterized protein n=1 Tax=Cutaneotrichosporon cavernicola TaxID=279322 RepID=A0AA48QVY7_9TREE|nr:uncharacterized protein CcaverHIS019_0404570 [Cutaneotrichosporon cavernicola]BEI83857.1 hypothetical protein CcaverHIS002_0404610 [Cutaneotrichosporon cavernicola]BEI91637.1 hypothetical protein CcaverHIS019_0404570 [Cutaneotrichosporon cavernicola]BEI99413.1 hypothetical protein CcaverHIS631_0404560 [Cutaneotrichosporon cavernicola]BEJ07191.1 hypothetical protein CcaverHIS641_0404600 [Cutaneotrichosporon cavernicola]
MLHLALLPFLAAPVAAHLSMWHPSMYGFEGDNPYAWEAIKPLARLNFNQWWFHGDIDRPPADGQVFNLPAGGVAHMEVGCQKSVTSYGGRKNQDLSCDEWGPIHLWQNNRDDVTGCAIAIAYESNVHAIKPEDFTVISTNRSCPYTRDVTFEIPDQLRECPPGGCHCMWGWVHSAMGGGEEIYFNGFKCQVTGANPNAPQMPRAQPPKKCSDGGCQQGAKQPIYWIQNEGNNIFNDVADPPFYNEKYGYANGAQNDIWGEGSGTANGSGNSGNNGSNSGNNNNGNGNSGNNNGGNGNSGNNNGGNGNSGNNNNGNGNWGNNGNGNGNGDGNGDGNSGTNNSGNGNGNNWGNGGDGESSSSKTRTRTRTRTRTQDWQESSTTTNRWEASTTDNWEASTTNNWEPTFTSYNPSPSGGGSDDWNNLVANATSSDVRSSATIPTPSPSGNEPEPAPTGGSCQAHQRRSRQVRVRRLKSLVEEK